MASRLSIDGMLGAFFVILAPVEVKLSQTVVSIQRAPAHGGVPDVLRLVLVAVAVVVEERLAGDLVVLVELDGGAAGWVGSVEVDGRLVVSTTILQLVLHLQSYQFYSSR